jgi:predicted nucleotidyltransferase
VKKSRKPDPKLLKRLVSIIVPLVHPKRIILFGSAARGQMKEHSDLDIMVVVRNGQHRRRTAKRIYMNLWGIEYVIDIVVITEEDIEKYRENPYMVIFHALKDGKELFHAA